jgi:hypothetical protein
MSSLTVERDRCLTLVRDTDRDDVMAGVASARGNVAKGRDGEVSDLRGVVLDLTGVREVLGELAVGGVDDIGLVVEGHRADPGGAGVEGEDELHVGQASEFPDSYWVPRFG